MMAWAQAHPHLATLAVLALLGLFLYLNIVFVMWPIIILVGLVAPVTLYLSVYFLIKDLR